MAQQALTTEAYGTNSKFTLGATASKGTTTLIAAETSFKGDIKSRGEVVISGVVEGEVVSEAKIVVAAGGSVTGRLSAAEIVLEGKLTGDAEAAQSTALLNGCELRGDVTTRQIMIEPGATFVGRCSMPEQAKGTATPAKS